MNSNLKLLFINETYNSGGAGIASKRIADGLSHKGIIIKWITAYEINKNIKVPFFISIDKEIYRITYRNGLRNIHIISNKYIKQWDIYKESELVHFHNIHAKQDFFNYLFIRSFSNEKPAIITLHDMWWFTGHCSFSYDCERWKKGCGKCPYPDTYPAIEKDATRIEHWLKKFVFTRSNIHFVAISKWMEDNLKKSFLKNKPIHFIPNGIDTSVYKPFQKSLQQEKIRLLFVAANTSDKRKGIDLLIKSLTDLPDYIKSKCELWVMGNGDEILQNFVGIPVVNLGYITDDHNKAEIYSASDIFLFPTRADNLPLVLQESMACGTPMISYDVGGVSDLVRHGQTGLLAEQENINQFTQHIITMVQNPELLQTFSANCRKIAIDEYDIEIAVQKYITLYESLVKKA